MGLFTSWIDIEKCVRTWTQYKCSRRSVCNTLTVTWATASVRRESVGLHADNVKPHDVDIFSSDFCSTCHCTKEFKWGYLVSFWPMLTLLGGGHFDGHVWRQVIVHLRFGTIIQRFLRNLSLLSVVEHDDLNTCVFRCEKGNTHLTKSLGGLGYKKSGGIITYLTARWPPWQIPLLTFLGWYSPKVPTKWNEL